MSKKALKISSDLPQKSNWSPNCFSYSQSYFLNKFNDFYILYVKVSLNNIFITLARNGSDVVLSFSGGQTSSKKKKSTLLNVIIFILIVILCFKIGSQIVSGMKKASDEYNTEEKSTNPN